MCFQSLQSLHSCHAEGGGAIGRVSRIVPSRENFSLHSRRPVRPVRAAPVCAAHVRTNSRRRLDFICNTLSFPDLNADLGFRRLIFRIEFRPEGINPFRPDTHFVTLAFNHFNRYFTL